MSPLCCWIFSSLNTGRTLARFPNESSKYSGSFIPSLRKNIYGITSMSTNQRFSIWMVPLPTGTPGIHQIIATPSLVFTPTGTFHNHRSYWRDLRSQYQQRYRWYRPLWLHPRHIANLDNPPPHILEKEFQKNGKLYGRSSQSSRITPRSLQEPLSLTLPLPTQAPPPPPITALPPLPPPPSPMTIP